MRQADGERRRCHEERETEAHRARGGWWLEHHPGKGPNALKAGARHQTPPRSQLSPPEGRARGRTHATLPSPRDTKIWDLCKPQSTPRLTQRGCPPRSWSRHHHLLRWGSPTTPVCPQRSASVKQSRWTHRPREGRGMPLSPNHVQSQLRHLLEVHQLPTGQAMPDPVRTRPSGHTGQRKGASPQSSSCLPDILGQPSKGVRSGRHARWPAR